jgi:GNAT superfamily N-acetyltransferase
VIDKIERLPWPWIKRHGLTVRWFDTWDSSLEGALKELPDSKDCPHELLKAIMRNPSGAKKCAALVTRGDRPAAVIALRRAGIMRWDVIGGGGVAPRFLAHAIQGELFPALSALGVNIHVATQAREPSERWVRRVVAHPVHRIDLKADFQAYWKKSGHLKTIRQARNRSQAFTIELNGQGAAEWTIRNWANRWRGQQTVSEDDLVVAAAYFGEAGRFHTIRLLDGREPISGHTFLVEGDGLLAISTYTRPDYRQFKAGTRALDAAFEWASSAGFDRMDLGVGHDYKTRWAPADGTRWSYDIRPWYLHVSAVVIRPGLRVGRRIMNAVRAPLRVRSSGPAPDEL